VRGDYNTRRNDARLSYQDVNGYGVGAYNISADIERSDDGAGINGTANYTSNHAELGLSHFTSFGGGGFSSVTDSRTSLNVGTSLAFADGALAIGRPISQAFAVVSANRNLNGAEVIVNPTPDNHYTASTDWLGNAVDPDLSAYVPRTITVDAPNAPEGYDLGSGSYRVMPPYRAGYNLQVGSEYWMTAFGRLLTASGEPLSLLAGKAIDEANPSHEPVAFFTNGQGRFGISGLKPGKWRLEMPTDPTTVYELVVPSDSKGLIRAGDLHPVGTGN
jgi:outer membrane usher protein